MSSNTGAATFRRAVLDAAIYIAIMGAGMALMHFGFGERYGEPGMLRVIGPVEVILTAWALVAAHRLGGLRAAGFGPLQPKALAWLVLLALPVAAGLATLVATVVRTPPASDQAGLLAGALATTALVGFSEELMFRGVLLRAAWRAHGLFRGMLASAVGFMLLHAVNVLGGSPPAAVGGQLGSTLLFGLATAPLAVRLGSLWPLVLLHWAWDFTLYAFACLGVAPPGFMLLLGPALLLTAALGWWALRRDRGAVLSGVEGGAA